jgi:hypothetical protein
MTRIGILTFHNNENRGAILQAFALRTVLADIFSGDVEIVEYRTRAKERKRRSQIFVTKEPMQAPRKFRDHRLVENFLSDRIPTSSDSLVTDDYNRAVDWINDQEYDILVTGSDEVWKIPSENGNDGIFSRFFPNRPFPNLYFLNPQLSATKTAYAASANTVDLDSLNQCQRNQLKSNLSAYDYISVRDRHTEQLLENLNISPVHRVPDPTLLIDIPTGDAAAILQENGVDLCKPILGFHGKQSPIFRNICEHYRNKGYQIVTSTASNYADVELEAKVDPFEYYAMYDHYDMVITSSLHSTIFSLKNGTPFATINVSDVYAGLESKTYSLLEDFSLLDRHISAVDDDASEFYNRVDELEQPLDEEHVENRISELRKKGFYFLEMVKEEYETND